MIIQRSTRFIRTLVVHTGGLGDFLLFCPTLKRLAEDGPIELAGSYRDRLNLAVVSGIAESVHDVDDFDFGSVFSAPSETFAAFISRFDRAVVWMSDDNGVIRRAFETVGLRNVDIFPGLPPLSWKRHASEYYAECFHMEALPPLTLPIAADDENHDVLIHPGSGSRYKNWPIERFVEVADYLPKNARHVEWIGGPAEEELCLPPEAKILTVPSVVTLARHLSAAKLYIGNDSGVTHLAAACGCKTVAIFGPTEPAVWAPRGNHVSVVAGEPWPTVAELIAKV